MYLDDFLLQAIIASEANDDSMPGRIEMSMISKYGRIWMSKMGK